MTKELTGKRTSKNYQSETCKATSKTGNENMETTDESMAVDGKLQESSSIKCLGFRSLLAACSVGCLDLLESLMKAHGRNIARHPYMVMLVCLAFTFCCTMGVLRFRTEARTEKLFLPQNSIAIRDNQRANKYFSIMTRAQTIILTPKKGNNVLLNECMEDALTAHDKVTNIGGYGELCASSGKLDYTAANWSSCLRIEPLELFKYNKTSIHNVSKKLTKAYLNPSCIMANGKPAFMNFQIIFGGMRMTRNDNTAVINSAGSIQMMYFLDESEDLEALEKILKWEDEFIARMEGLVKTLKYVNIFYSAHKSLDEAIAQSSASEAFLFTITFTLMIGFACASFIRFRDPTKGHSLLAFCGIMAVGFGVLAGLGLTMMYGVPYVSMVGVLPFLVLGVGIDDMFILVDQLDRQDLSQDCDVIVSDVMKHVGPSVTMTTLTDLVAFAVSTSTEFPAIRYFCIYAATSLTLVYLMMVTFFLACLTLDIRRMKSRRQDGPFCCITHAQQDIELPDPSHMDENSNRNKVMTKWGELIMHPAVKGFNVLFSLALLASGIYGAVQIDQRFDRSILAQEGTSFKDFINTQDSYYRRRYAVNIVLDDDIAYHDQASQQKIVKLSDIVAANPYYEDSVFNWMEAFHGFANQTRVNITGHDFLPALKTFLKIPRVSLFNGDIKFDRNGTRIVASRIVCKTKTSSSNIFNKNAMLTLREDLKKSTPLPAYLAEKNFMYFEQSVITLRETVRNLAIAGVTILVIMFPFIRCFRVTILVFCSFTALIFELFGLMYVWDMSLNSISMIVLVMALGFAVDYSAHVAHAFVTSREKTADLKVVYALSTTGISVLKGGFSTFLGLLATAFAKSEVFHIFFRMFLGIVLLGLLHGLCFLPVYLSIICSKQSVALTTPAKVGVAEETEPGDAGCHGDQHRDNNDKERQSNVDGADNLGLDAVENGKDTDENMKY